MKKEDIEVGKTYIIKRRGGNCKCPGCELIHKRETRDGFAVGLIRGIHFQAENSIDVIIKGLPGNIFLPPESIIKLYTQYNWKKL